jgi:signal transduction histidine kinase
MAAVALSGQVSVAYLQSIVCAQADFKRGVWPAGAAFGAANLAAWFGLQTAMGLPLSQVVGVESSLVVGFAFGLLVVALIERYARQTSRAEALLKELQIANFELETARQMERDLAVAAERVRLARDIHDGLGHHLTVLSIQLQAAAKLVERSPQDAAEAIRACREEAQAALDEVRSSVGLMRQPLAGSETLAEALASLVQNFDRRAGLRARFTCEGAPVELSPFARETLFRAVQEGLTNARKHARGASCVFVDLAYAPVSIRLRLRDDGEKPAGAPASGSPGFGLAGLRERVGRLGGDFRSGPGAAGGFELEICIPIEGKKDDPRAAG